MVSPSHSPFKRRRLQTPTPSLDQLLQSALSLPDPSLSIALSLDRILDSTPLHSDKTLLLSSATRFASALLDAATRSSRKLAAVHNSTAWPLSADLTVKVFSMLDSESVCVAAAACSLFSRCASDSLCYENIDLTSSAGKVTNPVVSTMIQKAGKNLRSLKLGRLPEDMNRWDDDASPLTGSCLAALTLDGGAAGLFLQKLHLYNIKINGYNPCAALSACKSLSDLEIIGWDIDYNSMLRTVIEHCRSIQHLTFDDSGNNELCAIKDMTKTCPLISSLSLRGFRISDDSVAALVKGACCLRYLDISASYDVTGSFLRDLSDDSGTNTLETLILRDCMTLTANEVSVFLSSALCGGWKALRYMDISNVEGLQGLGGSRTRCAVDVSQFIEGRPGIHLIADYPQEICFYGDCTTLPVPSSDNDLGSTSSCHETDSSSYTNDTSSTSYTGQASSSDDYSG